MYLVKHAWANSVDPDEMPQNAASHQGLHCLPLIQLFLDTTLELTVLVQILDKVWCLNTEGKYSKVTDTEIK